MNTNANLATGILVSATLVLLAIGAWYLLAEAPQLSARTHHHGQ